MEKKRILIVDDEVGPARLLRVNLEETGCYEVRVEHLAEHAVEAGRDFKPHIVLLDVFMPRMPGGNVAAAFEADPSLKNSLIVFLTAAVQRHQVEEHDGRISNYPCLAKPASLDEIVQCIELNLPKRFERSSFRRHMLPREIYDEEC